MRAMRWGFVLICGWLLYAAQGPIFSPSGPDAEAYGETQHYPVGTAETAFEKRFMVGSFSHFETIFPNHVVLPAAQAWQFQRPQTAPQIVYRHAGEHYTLTDYLAHLPVTGLFIAKGDEVLYEGYQYGRTDHDLFTSQSMVKSVTAMLVGIAISEQAIGGVEDAASKYVPELAGSDYGKAKLRDLLHMSSGVTCTIEDDSLDKMNAKMLSHDCKQTAAAGTSFKYSASDSEVLGLVVERAVHMPLASYLQEKVWQKIGTESRAAWMVDKAGMETPFCCFDATLRDYARFARLLAFDGNWNGTQLISQQWLTEATTLKEADAQLMPGKPMPFFGYGYQVWIFPSSPRRMFGLIGANGQRIFVDPKSKLILVQTAVTEKAMDREKDGEMIGLWLSLVHTYGGE